MECHNTALHARAKKYLSTRRWLSQSIVLRAVLVVIHRSGSKVLAVSRWSAYPSIFSVNADISDRQRSATPVVSRCSYRRAEVRLTLLASERRRQAQTPLDALEAFWSEWFKSEKGQDTAGIGRCAPKIIVHAQQT
jgi:hypothetical protein